jgi:GDP-L-fucose synthase
MVGSAIVRKLTAEGYTNIITKTHAELDLTNQTAVRDFFQNQKIDYVVLAAAKVGGIYANNTYPAEFIYQNLMIQTNVIHEAYASGVEHLLFLGSSCIYPKNCPQPMKEEYLLSGYLEPTNEPYAIAKIAGIKMCESYNRQYGTQYRSIMPTNLYGPDDNYHLENSHVIPAMIRKYHLAKLAMEGNLKAIQDDEKTYGVIPQDIKRALCLKPDSSGFLKGNKFFGSSNINGFQFSAFRAEALPFSPRRCCPHVLLWGSGKAKREFLHVDDMAAGCYHTMQHSLRSSGCNLTPHSMFCNIGTGKDITIREVAEVICEIIGFEGDTIYDSEKPDGAPQKLLDTSLIKSQGWYPQLDLRSGLEDTYGWYVNNMGCI